MEWAGNVFNLTSHLGAIAKSVTRDTKLFVTLYFHGDLNIRLKFLFILRYYVHMDFHKKNQLSATLFLSQAKM